MNQHDDLQDDSLRDQLAELTSWRGGETSLWQRALERETARRRQPLWRVIGAVGNWPTYRIAAAAVICLLLTATIIVLMQPAGLAQSQRQSRSTAPSAQGSWVHDRQLTLVDQSMVAGYGMPEQDLQSAGGAGTGGGGGDARLHSLAIMSNQYKADQASAPAEPDGPGERAVIRKATVELIAEDVRSAFQKAMLIVSEASNEYIEESSLTGEGVEARATLKLRVRVDRLSAVLQELRQIGAVASENQSGEDVTAQGVDLEARLRNETRIEQELLDLLETRTDAPLKEVLELHEHLGRVRNGIESLQAQRERLGRLVSLATVLVLIRPEPEQPKPVEEVKEQTIGAYFAANVSDSWTSGLRFLADSIASLLRVLVGGILWWLAALIIVLWAWPHVRRRLASGA